MHDEQLLTNTGDAKPFTFRSQGHKQRFLEAMIQTEKVYDGQIDREYGAALFLLTAQASIWEKVSSYVRSSGIPFPTIRKKVHFSSSESVMVLLAGNLFNGMSHVDPLEFMRLDQGNFEVALQALRMRRNPMLLLPVS